MISPACAVVGAACYRSGRLAASSRRIGRVVRFVGEGFDQSTATYVNLRETFAVRFAKATARVRHTDQTSAHRPDVTSQAKAAQGASQRGRADPLSCRRFNVDERELAVERVVVGILLVSRLGSRMFSDVTVTPLAMYH